jgi:hypothetical protein
MARLGLAAPALDIGQSGSVTKRVQGPDEVDDPVLLALFVAIASRDEVGVARMLDQQPGLASHPLTVGASRRVPLPFFLIPIRHYVYTGDTALHVAAAAHHTGLAETLVAHGAAVRARNRRGAEPLHFAADGHPRAEFFDSDAQRGMIWYLIDAGADPDVTDYNGTAPLHRAVRTRSSAAVAALLDRGADPRLMEKKSGSTPLHLAVQYSNKSGSRSEAAKEEQRQIIVLLLGHGASGADLDAKGKTVAAAASSGWIRELLDM